MFASGPCERESGVETVDSVSGRRQGMFQAGVTLIDINNNKTGL